MEPGFGDSSLNPGQLKHQHQFISFQYATRNFINGRLLQIHSTEVIDQEGDILRVFEFAEP